MNANIDIKPIENCINPWSYGMICTKCNKCKRFYKGKIAKGD